MPIIQIEHSKSPAKGEYAFWFDTDKPRVKTEAAVEKAMERLNQHQAVQGEKRLKLKDIHSFDHNDGDRSNGSVDNLFACTSQEQHTNIELQRIELFTTLYNMGKIGFDYFSKKYFVACENLKNDIKKWIDEGMPKRPFIVGGFNKI